MTEDAGQYRNFCEPNSRLPKLGKKLLALGRNLEEAGKKKKIAGHPRNDMSETSSPRRVKKQKRSFL